MVRELVPVLVRALAPVLAPVLIPVLALAWIPVSDAVVEMASARASVRELVLA